MRIDEDIMYIESPMELESEMCRYNCKTKEELDTLLWTEYGVVLVINY